MRPKESAQGTRVAFMRPPIKIQLFTTSPPKFQIISLPPPEAAVMVSHHSRKGYPITHIFYLQIIQDNLSFQHKPSKSFTWETSFNNAFCWNDKSPVTRVLSVSCLQTEVLIRFPVIYNDLHSCQVRTFEPCPFLTLFNTLHFRCSL